VIEALHAKQRFTAVTTDLPGHGRASAWRGDWPALLDQIDAAIAAEAEAVTVVGYSMGARILRRLLLRSGPDLAGAILVAPHPGLDPAQARARRLRDDALAARFLAQPIQSSVAQWSMLDVFAGQACAGELALQQQKQIRLSQNARGLAFALRRFGSGTCEVGGQRQRQAQITLIHGDRLASDQQRAARQQRLWPDAQRCVIAGLGHNPILEDPQVFLEHLSTAALGARPS